jgi:hypothetical protein
VEPGESNISTNRSLLTNMEVLFVMVLTIDDDELGPAFAIMMKEY